MKDGTEIAIQDMTDTHLVNTIRMLERYHEAKKFEIPYPNFNGDMAQWCAEREYDSFMESDPSVSYPVYDDLVDEFFRRDLDMKGYDINL